MEIPWSFFRKAALVLFGISLLAGLASTALFIPSTSTPACPSMRCARERAADALGSPGAVVVVVAGHGTPPSGDAHATPEETANEPLRLNDPFS